MQIITVVNVQPKLATTHAKLITHSLGLVNHALGAHRPIESPNTPNSLLRELQLWYILPALLHSHGGRMSRTERFKSAERGNLNTILPWLMEYAEGTATRLWGAARKETDAAKFERAALAAVASRGLLAEPRAPGNEATRTIVKTKFPEEDRNSVQAAAAAARVTSVTEPAEWSGPTWRPEGEFNAQVAFGVINVRKGLSGTGSDGLRF